MAWTDTEKSAGEMQSARKRQLQAEAQASGRPLRIHVEPFARFAVRRSGFRTPNSERRTPNHENLNRT
jgi:hypothetical protein